MDYEVAKPFNTVNRRFAPGSGPGGTVSNTDDIAPFTIAERLERSFIKAPLSTGVEPAALAPRSIKQPPAGTDDK